jgi:hypothetical protein
MSSEVAKQKGTSEEGALPRSPGAQKITLCICFGFLTTILLTGAQTNNRADIAILRWYTAAMNTADSQGSVFTVRASDGAVLPRGTENAFFLASRKMSSIAKDSHA